MASSLSASTYDGWTREELIARLTELDNVQARPKQRPPSPKPRIKKTFQFNAHSRRKIALKFCYSGWEYGGLAFQYQKTTLPTVEGVLFNALVKARLIDPEGGFDGCGWTKCGRTDRGVSAAGQVISLWVRRLEFGFDEDDLKDVPLNSSLSKPTSIQNEKYEYEYLLILNRLLPPTIRILAWSPVSDDFSARFSCTYRHYKYFFSRNTATGSILDIERMRTAASYLVGEHDFRNLCKIDPSKQITMFKRKVLSAEIDPISIDAEGNGDYVLNLVGTAFLYHQVRNIMAVLFMVGHGQEDPSVVTSLMNVEEGSEPGATEVVDTKPQYQMADALPLMLWDCGYPEGELDWRTTNGASLSDENEDGRSELYQQLHSIHSRSRVYTALNNHFLLAASRFHLQKNGLPAPSAPSSTSQVAKLMISLGGGTYKRTGQDKYTPLLKRNRLDHVDLTNERWRLGKGFRRNERKKALDEEGSIDDLDGNE
ncbi:Putative tRNA pseudouridine synthase C25B8.05 [Termitomyces sp. J132]|nr:Putative tRNA pseudouridine synthase C25B8.05 [Termitomyces sp. J132]